MEDVVDFTKKHSEEDEAEAELDEAAELEADEADEADEAAAADERMMSGQLDLSLLLPNEYKVLMPSKPLRVSSPSPDP